MRVLLLSLLAVLPAETPPAQGVGEGGESESSLVLENGIRVRFVPVPSVDRQTTMTFLDLSPFGDPLGELEMAHLLEHMMRRSTDPEGESVDGIVLAGWTSATRVRLSSTAPVERWQEGLDRHATWLRPTEWEQGVLERELAAIEAERARAGTEPMEGHRYALGAWAQVLRFGTDEVRLQDAIRTLSAQDVKREIRARVPVGGGVEVWCVGPVPREELEPALRNGLGALEPTESRSGLSPLAAELPDESTCRWDLPFRQLCVWYPVPLEEPWHRMGAGLLAERLNFRFAQHEDDELAGGKAWAGVVEPMRGSPLLIVSLRLDAGTKERHALKELDLEIRNLPRSRGLTFRDQLAQLGPDSPMAMGGGIGSHVARVRSFLSPRQLEVKEAREGFTEVGLVLERVRLEITFGAPLTRLAVLAEGMDVNDLERLPMSLFAKKSRRQLLLEPAG